MKNTIEFNGRTYRTNERGHILVKDMYAEDIKVPVYAMVSSDGGTFTVYYRAVAEKTGACMATSVSGCSDDIFKNCPSWLPVVMWGNYKYRSNFAEVLEVHAPSMFSSAIPFSAWLEMVIKNGAHVIHMAEYRGYVGKSNDKSDLEMTLR